MASNIETLAYEAADRVSEHVGGIQNSRPQIADASHRAAFISTYAALFRLEAQHTGKPVEPGQLETVVKEYDAKRREQFKKEIRVAAEYATATKQRALDTVA